jgi:flagellar biogenesis protein FliO
MDDVLAGYGGRFLLATAIVSVALIVFIGMLWILKRRAPTSFVARVKRNKKSRLQVLEHAAVDTRRQIVLIRRDDVEHLVMIGGSTDIVIESNIPNRYSAADGQNAGTFENPSAADTFDIATIQAVTPVAKPVAEAAPLKRPSDDDVSIKRVEDMERGLDEAVSMLRSEAALSRGAAEPAPAVSAPDQPARPANPAAPNPGGQTMSATVAPQTGASRGNPVSVEPMGFSTPPMQPAKTILTGTGSIFTDDAEDALERARQRIIKPAPRPQSGANRNEDAPETSPEIRTQEPWIPSPRGAEPAAFDAQPNATNFESILQAEMDRIPVSPEPSQPAQTRPSQANVAPPITGVSRDEQILQNEIAKIFGEMTFDRKKT